MGILSARLPIGLPRSAVAGRQQRQQLDEIETTLDEPHDIARSERRYGF
jgi:hypothetical protein